MVIQEFHDRSHGGMRRTIRFSFTGADRDKVRQRREIHEKNRYKPLYKKSVLQKDDCGGAVPAVCQAGGARQDVSAAYRKESALPAFKYTGNKKELAVICEYLLEKKAPLYKDADVFIPAPVIFGIREKGGETLVFGNFWIFGYDLSGATLICESGGAMPACFHLAKDGDSYKVTKVEQAEDGAGFTDSIEKMTKGYKKIRKKMLVSNEKKEKQVRRNWIRNYVQANNLAVTAYKDYGWDPVSVR